MEKYLHCWWGLWFHLPSLKIKRYYVHQNVETETKLSLARFFS